VFENDHDRSGVKQLLEADPLAGAVGQDEFRRHLADGKALVPEIAGQ